MLTADDDRSTGSPIAFAGDRRRQVAVDVPPLRPHRPDRDEHRGRARVRRLGSRDLRRAALMHDVGKLAISNRILDKPDPLTVAEYARVKRASAVHAVGARARGPPRRARRRLAAPITSASTAAATRADWRAYELTPPMRAARGGGRLRGPDGPSARTARRSRLRRRARRDSPGRARTGPTPRRSRRRRASSTAVPRCRRADRLAAPTVVLLRQAAVDLGRRGDVGRPACNSGSVVRERRRPAASSSNSDTIPPRESETAPLSLLPATARAPAALTAAAPYPAGTAPGCDGSTPRHREAVDA